MHQISLCSLYIESVQNYSGIKFICIAPGRFQVVPKVWRYTSNSETSIIRVSQIGVCNSDFSRLFLGTGHTYPITIGHEISGKLECAGKELESQLGKSVCIFPLIPCQNCNSCRIQAFNLCSHYSYLGSRQDGGMSTFLEVPNWNILLLSKNIKSSFLPMIEPVAVVFHAIRMLSDQTSGLLITGSGFLSYIALKISQTLKFNRIAVVSGTKSNSRLFEDSFISTTDGSAERFNSCLDFSANESLMHTVTKYLIPGSTIVTVANSRNDTYLSRAARENVLRKELIYRGSWNSSYKIQRDDWTDAINFLAQDPMLEFPLREVKLNEFPSFLESLNSTPPKERIHVLC